MSSRIARLLIGMAVAVAIVPLGIGAVGSAAAHPSGLRLAAQDCLTNRSESPVSETDARYAGRRDRREAAPATGLLGLTGLSRKFYPAGVAPRGLTPHVLLPWITARYDPADVRRAIAGAILWKGDDARDNTADVLRGRALAAGCHFGQSCPAA